jgi:hypothetical protein
MAMTKLPYSLWTSKTILAPASEWCKENFGPRWDGIGNRTGTWSVFWGGNTVENYPSTYQWHFATEEQLMWFKLRWT